MRLTGNAVLFVVVFSRPMTMTVVTEIL